MSLQTMIALCALIGHPEALDAWWGIQLAGQPVGYYHEEVRLLANGDTVTRAEMKMVLNRLGHKVEFNTTSETVENPDGELRTVHSTTQASAKIMKLNAERKESTLKITTEAGGKTYTQDVPVMGALSGPANFDRHSRSALQKPGDRISESIFVPELGKITRETRTLLGMQQRLGRPVRKIEDEIEGVPGKQTLLVAADGAVLERREPFPFGDLLLTPTDRLAAQAMTAGGTLPQELYDRTLIRSNVRLPDPRSIDRVRLRLTHHRQELGWPELAGDYQTVLATTPTTRIIEIRRPAAPRPGSLPTSPAMGATDTEYCEANALIQSDDPLVAGVVKQTTGERNSYRAARILQDWVASHMHFDLGIALAPASEVMRDRKGTCAAYAVLLCALERAAGLSARVAWGYVYEEGIWGGHAWTEVRLGDQWVPLDAAMYAPGVADAARFRFATSSLQNGPSALTGAGLQLYGNIEVQVLEYTLGGRTIRVPADAAPDHITGDTYTNPWLGVAIRKPHAWRFSNRKQVFPDPTLVAMQGEKGALVKLQTESLCGGSDEVAHLFASYGLPPHGRVTRCAGHRAYRVDTPTRAMIVLPVGRAVWMLSAQGPQASHSLDKVASTWTLR